MSTSKLQRLVSKYLYDNFGKYTIRENSRPEWLFDETGRRLELDFYVEELRLAIEVQGIQHYQYNEIFHGSLDGFLDQISRDKLKASACDKNDITLIEISSESDVNILDNYLPEHDEISKEIDSPKIHPYSNFDKNWAVWFVRGKRTEIDRLLSMNPVPNSSIQNVIESIRDVIDRYCLVDSAL